MRPELEGFFITSDNLANIYNSDERLFAAACLEKGLLVYSQIPLEGDSTIDFFIINPNLPDSGTLVEVTHFDKKTLDSYVPTFPPQKDKKTLFRKHKQMANMRRTGLRWTVIRFEELENIAKKCQEIPDYVPDKKAFIWRYADTIPATLE